MSWDCYLVNKKGKTIETTDPHFVQGGGTYAVGGMKELWISVTYNYGKIYRAVLGGNGLNDLDGKTGAESVPWLEIGIAKLGNDVSTDYWEATEGNAKAALFDLVALAKMAPDGRWRLT